MKRYLFFLTLIAILSISLPAYSVPTDKKSSANEDEWTSMPAGGRPAYMSIQGGTMPVSLLVAGNGKALLTFVGRTGNDFLEVLKATDLPLPSLLNATKSHSNPLPLPANCGLFAGNATASLPVIALSGEKLAAHQDKLQPFGLSDQPLCIEGEILRPAATSKAKSCRLFFLPAFLQPKR